MRELGHIGAGYTYLSTCAATVYGVHLAAGIELPPIPKDKQGKKYWASLALVEAMEWLAKKHDVYYSKRSIETWDENIPKRGWTVFFDWDGDQWEDHTGIVLGADANGVKTFEGNRGNKTVIGHRPYAHISGYADFSRIETHTELS
jgi:hypothetical protein